LTIGVVTHLVATYGYLAVFGAVAIESLGVPFPGETTLVAAGIYAGTTHHLDATGVVLAAVAGAITGDNIGYLIGAKVGYRLLRRFGPRVGIDQGAIKTGRYLFDRYGALVVLLGRFFLVLRTLAAFLAGVNRLAWPRFLAANALGAMAWAALFGFGSYELGAVFEHLGTVLRIVLGALGLSVTVLLLYMGRRFGARLRARAEVAMPGPLSD
jgi:membrane protein DedA with SNARE-associated domain